MKKLYIKEALMYEGKELFSNYGLQKTTISDITKKVGIATGTFYNYYTSKEELYFDILEKEERQIREQFINAKVTKSQRPKQALKTLLQKMIHMIETNPLIRQLYFDNNMTALMSKLPQEKLTKHFEKDTDVFVSVINDWKNAGMIVNENPETLAGVFRALFVLTLHKKEIGEEVYRATIDWYIEQIVAGIFKEKR